MRIAHFLLNMTLQNWWGVAAYTLVITATACSSSVAILFALSWPDITSWDWIRAIIIALVVAPPLGVFGGWHLLRITKLSEELARLVARDRLTDVATRDYFFKQMERAPEAFGVSLMLDIDHFKSVNDTHGHLVGDSVIRSVSDVMRQECRTQDIVCRFGGEEFVIFLHEASEEMGYEIAERIRVKVAQLLVDAETTTLTVTISIGGSLKDRMKDINAAIREADEALYRAKRGGRNRTEVSWEQDQRMADIA